MITLLHSALFFIAVITSDLQQTVETVILRTNSALQKTGRKDNRTAANMEYRVDGGILSWNTFQAMKEM